MRQITPPSTYLPVEGKDLINLDNSAEHVLASLKKLYGDLAKYDGSAVKTLSDDLTANRHKYIANDDSKRTIMWTYGAFLGKALIESAPRGRCVWVDNKIDNFCLKILTPTGEATFAAPFTRVAKHLVDGPEYSMIALYMAIHNVLDSGLPKA